MFESVFIIVMLLITMCILIYLRIAEEIARRQANQPKLKELNKVWKQYHKNKKEQLGHKNLLDDLPLFMEKEDFFNVD